MVGAFDSYLVCRARVVQIWGMSRWDIDAASKMNSDEPGRWLLQILTKK